MPYERLFSLVFWEEEWFLGATPSTWNFGFTGPCLSKIAGIERIIARSASAVTCSKKVQSTLIESPQRALKWAQDDRRTLPLCPQRGSRKRPISVKIARRLKKVCYKVSLSEMCERQSCKAFIGLTNRAKMIGGGDPLYLKFWIKVTAFERNRRFSLYCHS